MTPARRRRIGFTLVELLVVITIIGVLIGLLVPVIWSAVRKANETRVAAEINTIAQALASFKSEYQEYPPSRVILVESGAFGSGQPADRTGYYGIQATGDTSGQMTYSENYPNIGDGAFHVDATPVGHNSYASLVQRSVGVMRKFFAKVQVTAGTTPPAALPTPGFYDFNGNLTLDEEPILLEGHECLVFFLGGVPNHDGPPGGGGTYTLNGMGGFGSNPRNPFVSLAAAGSGNRLQPFFEFDAARLVDDDYDGIPGYVDTLGSMTQARYFAYFSAYEGAGYDPNDVNFEGTPTSEPAPLGREFTLAFPVPTTSAPNNRVTTSPLPNPYTSSLATPANGSAATFQNPQSFQIISAGRDGLYGTGGQYDEGSTETKLPTSVAGESRARENDNITSFANGTLD